MLNPILNLNKNILHNIKQHIQSPRQFYKWLLIVFNGVDDDRVKKVGPDRACTEWLLRNGASVKFIGEEEFLTDYNSLPDEDVKFHIEKVDASDSAIHHLGFPHFSGCNNIEEIKLVRCSYVENDALPLLSVLKESLKYLEVIECKNVTDEALLSLKNLKKLRTLRLGGFPYVKNEANIVSQLSKALPNCKIDYY